MNMYLQDKSREHLIIMMHNGKQILIDCADVGRMLITTSACVSTTFVHVPCMQQRRTTSIYNN